MTISFRQRASRGFTLIELLIVVIIIAILAAIAIPQFSSSSKDAQESALDANLATVRSSIELYRVQHANNYPGVKASSGATCTGGAAGSGAALNTAAVTDQLTAYSNADGQTCTAKSDAFPYGPYMRTIPAEPFGNVNTVVASNAVLAPPTTAGTGWLYSTLTGQIMVNTNAADSKSKPYSSH